MRDGNIVVLSLASLLGKVGRKYWIPITDEFSGIENGIAQVSGASFLHVSVAAGKLSKRQYEQITGRRQKHEVIAYQIR